MMNLLTLKLNEDMEKMVKRNDLIIEFNSNIIIARYIDDIYYDETECCPYVVKTITKIWKKRNNKWKEESKRQEQFNCLYGYGENREEGDFFMVKLSSLRNEDEGIVIIRDGNYEWDDNWYFTYNRNIIEEAKTPSDLFPATGMEVL